ncbi:spinster family MFS transporter [Tautonia plasticadhaerens]|uniref:L-galactonate transporter n=1 Tax=Tautonia plasticadhaerens TaxID=2527974 RepID=A0A518GXN1_9BACT|nr:MFS transporter [Tautonia plasticadhaerens]QDV33312.1 L-galactonate transporter [Tautonia plasticadhaerens]
MADLEVPSGPAPERRPEGPPPGGPIATTLTRVAVTTFAVLFTIHLLDYLDRWALAGVLKRVQVDLGMSDGQAGSLNFYFLLTFSLISPIMGFAGDRLRRTWLLAGGVGLWSLATVGTGLVRSYGELTVARSLLGIGEATYGVLAPTILADLFRRESRARAMAAFYLAMPLGYAMGVFGAAWIATNSPDWLAGTGLERWAGWRMAFFIVGGPGLLAAFFCLFLPEPTRGASEDIDPERARAAEGVRPTKEDYADLAVNSSYTYCVFGQATFTFAFGGLAYWLPSYLDRVKGFGSERAALVVGLSGGLSAIIGMTLGGWLADKLSKTNPRALFLVPGLSMILAVPFVIATVFARSDAFIIGSMFLAMTLMLMNTGPCSAVIANVVTPNMRGVAFAVSIFFIHVLGDLWSPWLMGLASDYLGHPEVMASWIGERLQAIGAEPVEQEDGSYRNLTAGMLVVVPAILLGGCVLLAGARHLPREMALMLAKLRSSATARGK